MESEVILMNTDETTYRRTLTYRDSLNDIIKRTGSRRNLGLPQQGPDPSGEARHDLQVFDGLRRIFHVIDMYSRVLKTEHAVTEPQLICLAAIAGGERITASVLSKRLHLSQSTVTGILDRLEKKGLVERTRDTQDRRKVNLRVTTTGHSMLEHAPAPVQLALVKAVSDMSEEEQAAIADSLFRIVRLLNDHVRDTQEGGSRN